MRVPLVPDYQVRLCRVIVVCKRPNISLVSSSIRGNLKSPMDKYSCAFTLAVIVQFFVHLKAQLIFIDTPG